MNTRCTSCGASLSDPQAWRCTACGRLLSEPTRDLGAIELEEPSTLMSADVDLLDPSLRELPLPPDMDELPTFADEPPAPRSPTPAQTPRPGGPPRPGPAQQEPLDAAAAIPVASPIAAPPRPSQPISRRPMPTRNPRASQPDRAPRIIGGVVAVVIVVGGAWAFWAFQRNREGIEPGDNATSTIVSQMGDDLSAVGEQADAVKDGALKRIQTPKIPQGAGDYYEERTEIGPDGRTIVVWAPRDEAVAPPTHAPIDSAGARDAARGGSLKDEHGQVFDLSRHQGKVVVLNVFATWCEPCRKEIPAFAALNQEAERGTLPVRLYGVLVDSGPAPKALKGARAMGANYPLLLGDDAFQKSWRIESLPTTLVFRADGTLHHRVDAPLTFMELRRLVQGATQEEGAAP